MKRGRLQLPLHRAWTVKEQQHAYRLVARLLATQTAQLNADAITCERLLLCGPLGPDFATATAA